MYTLFLATCIVACLIIAGYVICEVIADKWAAYQDGARETLDFADIKVQPEPIWPSEFSERSRLVSVPLQRPRLRLVEDIDAGEWAQLWSVVDSMPEQRQAGEGS